MLNINNNLEGDVTDAMLDALDPFADALVDALLDVDKPIRQALMDRTMPLAAALASNEDLTREQSITVLKAVAQGCAVMEEIGGAIRENMLV